MTVDRTRLRSRYLDRERTRRLGPDISLSLLSYEQVDGEVELLALRDGWCPTESEDSETSQVKLFIADDGPVTAEIMNEVARFSISETRYRVIQGGITPPLSEPREWIVKGEEIRDV